MIRYRSFLLFTALLIGHFSASAAPDVNTVRLNIRVVCVAYHATVREIQLGAVEPDKRLSFRLFDDAFSAPQKYHGPSVVPLYLAGQEQPFTRVTVPAGTKDLIFLCIPMAGKSAVNPYRVFPVVSGGNRFPFGTRRIFNLTKQNIGIRYGQKEKRLVIPSGIKPTDLVVTEATTGERRFAVEFFTRSEEQWIRFSATRWTVDASKRAFLFIFEDPQTGRVSYRAVSEYYVDPALVKRKEEEAAKMDEAQAEQQAEEERKQKEFDAKIRAEQERKKKQREAENENAG